jgi:hypothetical protein
MPQDNKVQTKNGVGLAFGITSLVTGIIAFLISWIFFLSIPIGAVAVVFGALGLRKPESKGLAIAGLITGIIGLFFGLAMLLIAIIGSIAAAPSAAGYFYY